MIIYLIFNSIAFLCGFLWTGLDWIGSSKYYRSVKVNYRMPVTYLLPGYVLGHYLLHFLIWEF